MLSLFFLLCQCCGVSLGCFIFQQIRCICVLIQSKKLNFELYCIKCHLWQVTGCPGHSACIVLTVQSFLPCFTQSSCWNCLVILTVAGWNVRFVVVWCVIIRTSFKVWQHRCWLWEGVRERPVPLYLKSRFSLILPLFPLPLLPSFHWAQRQNDVWYWY